MGGRGWAGWSGVKGGKWDNCNSIINKYVLKNKIKIKKKEKQVVSSFRLYTGVEQGRKGLAMGGWVTNQQCWPQGLNGGLPKRPLPTSFSPSPKEEQPLLFIDLFPYLPD